MATTIGNIAVASASSTSLKGCYTRRNVALSSSSSGRGSLHSASSWSGFPRLSIQDGCGKRRPQIITTTTCLSDRARIESDVSATKAGVIGTLHQLNGIEEEHANYNQAPNTVVAAEYELLLKEKAQEVGGDLRGTCIFLIGMMGSGKTTVGKILSDALGYYFFDSDELVEQAAGGATVAQIFEENDEESFRDAESEVLSQLSSMVRLVVATGGGAVVRSHNWGYLRHGITVWLNVPLDALAKRVMAVGTESRPLLEPDCAHHQAVSRLSKLLEERGPAYTNADATVSVEELTSELGIEDSSALTPVMLAVKVLDKISELLREKKRTRPPVGC